MDENMNNINNENNSVANNDQTQTFNNDVPGGTVQNEAKNQNVQSTDGYHKEYEYHQSFAGQGQNQYNNANTFNAGTQTNQNAYQNNSYMGYQQYQPYNGESKKKQKKEKSGSGLSGRAVALIVCCCIICSAVFGFGGMAIGYSMLKDNDTHAEGDDKIVGGFEQDAMKDGDKSELPSDKRDYASVIYKTVEGSSAGLGDNDSGAQVYKVASPSVVEITTESVATSSFLGQYITDGAGSGVIISEDGYIITNNHVIDGAINVTIRTSNGESYTAEVIGSDEQTDIAIIKIDAEGLTPAVLGNSSDLIVGQKVFAIGNPLGTLGGSITDGMISALEREVTIEGQTMTLLQTNTAINPGNSGGGLFNANGELIGVVNAKSSGSGIEGIGFAIPIDDVKDIIDQLIEYGYIRGRAKIGINYIEITSTTDYWKYITSEIGRYITDYGVYVTASESDALKFGDRIVAIGDVSVSTGSDIKSELVNYSVGDVMEITVVRGQKMTKVEIELTEYVPEDVQTSEAAK